MTRSTEHDFTHGKNIDVLVGDCIESMRSLPDKSVHTCVTSPPYWGLRDYGKDEQIGLEQTPEAFVEALVNVFREVKRILRDDGTLWLNLGDSYCAGSRKTSTPQTISGGERDLPMTSRNQASGYLKDKDLVGIPWLVALALQREGWWLRQDIIWAKPNCMPESMKDRCTKSHEYIFLLTKSPTYYFDQEAIKEQTTDSSGTKIKRSVWWVSPKAFKEAHFAVFPPELIEPCVLAGCPKGGTVLDPFGGSGTTAGVALKHGRKAIMCELNPEYAAIMPKRIEAISGLSATQKTLMDW